MDHKNKRFPKDREEMRLKGPVMKIDPKIYEVKLIGGFLVQGELDDEFFNRERETYCFDENGIKTEEESLTTRGHYSKYIFNVKGEIIGNVYTENGIVRSSFVTEFDEKGNPSKHIHYDKDKNIRLISIPTYDEKDLLINSKTYDKNMQLKQSCDIIYDDRGCKIEQKHVNADGAIELWNLYTNDEHGNTTVTKRLNPDGSIQATDHRTYEYDSNGKMISMFDFLYPKEGIASYREYEHDRYGNWITRVGFYKDAPTAMYIRDIYYHGDSDKDIVHADAIKRIPYDFEKINKEAGRSKNIASAPKILLQYKEFELNEAKWLAELCTMETFPVVRYYALTNKCLPSTSSFYGQDIEVMSLLMLLMKEMGAQVIHSNTQYFTDDKSQHFNSYTLIFPNRSYVLQANSISTEEKSQYQLPDFFIKINSLFATYVTIGKLVLFHPDDESSKKDSDFEEELNNYINLCSLDKLPELPEIQMVEVTSGGDFKLKSYPVHDDFVIKNLDLHYGYGFETFHNDLMDRFKNETKGLVLFHGEPGTGKTYYIRHLLGKMTGNKKVVIYMPPNMVERLVDPIFITFLLKEIGRFSRDGYFCVLLVEDAEPLLASRQTEGRVMGVSNLLNLTDGLLNDMLKLQVICTFNVKINELDKALLRPGRLVARKEFKAMSMIDANRLAQQLGVKHHFTREANLAEVFALQKNKSTLTHNPIEHQDI